MATLGEILGGIVRDVVQAHLLGDRLACDAAKAYATDPLLSAFPVPRVGVKDVSVKLRFAVDAVAEKDLRKEAEAEARELWKRELATNLLARMAGTAAHADSLKVASDSIARAPTPEFGLAAALNGNAPRMVRASVAFLVGVIAGLPLEVRRKLGSVRAAAAREIPTAVEDFLLRARQLLDAKAAARTDLHVLVRKADLEKALEQTIHEFTFTVALDDLRLTGPAAMTAKGDS